VLVSDNRAERFPIGSAITLAALEKDPYPIFARLQADEPVSWVAALKMWYVTRYEDVRNALLDTTHLTTASEQSLIAGTFGAHLLTTEGETHDHYRQATQYLFSAPFVRDRIEEGIATLASALVGDLKGASSVDFRSTFASRLPIQVMLLLCGLPQTAEVEMRRWYDTFEAALSNFTRDPEVSARAVQSVKEFHALLDEGLHTAVDSNPNSLLARLTTMEVPGRLTHEEIKRNLSIIFFGGISTVEALLLNTLWALFEHPDVLARVRIDLSLLPKVIEETIRWLSPVQSATRHVARPWVWNGVAFAVGETVNCMLGAANRDPSVFANPERFDIDRPNVRRHLGFATGVHTCLGSNLARSEVRIALEILLRQFPNLRMDGTASDSPSGYEFRQPRKLALACD
jgi:cytochrome P450